MLDVGECGRMSLRYAALFEVTQADDVAGLLCLEDAEFVEAAIRILVDGEVGRLQIDQMVGLLRKGYSKHFVLNKLSGVFDESFKPGRLPGVRRCLRRYRLAQIPVIGGALGRLFGMSGESFRERRFRVLENQLYLLAKASDSEIIEGIGACPWGGIHRLALLDRVDALEVGTQPKVLAIANDLLRVAAVHRAAARVKADASAD